MTIIDKLLARPDFVMLKRTTEASPLRRFLVHVISQHPLDGEYGIMKFYGESPDVAAQAALDYVTTPFSYV